MGQLLVVQRASDLVVKGPNETRDVPIDWSDDLPDGVTITGSTFTPSTGLTVDSSTFNNTATAVRLTGGILGRRYTVRNRVSLSDGEVFEYEFRVRVKE